MTEVKSAALRDDSGILPDAKLQPADFVSVGHPKAESVLAISSMRQSMKKEMKVVLGASYQVAFGTSGFINQVVSNDLVSALSEFTSLATLFSEFFINKFEVTYQPLNRYAKQSTGGVQDVPIVIADLQHATATYQSHTAASANGNLLIANTADPWKATWVNTEVKRSGVAPSGSTASPLPCQGWCLTASDNASLYTGSLQIVSPTVYDGTPSALLGTAVVRWSISFRSRA